MKKTELAPAQDSLRRITWKKWRSTRENIAKRPDVFAFGDSRSLANELVALVKVGCKQALLFRHYVSHL
jgi:uncharacterized protein YhfF